MFPVTLLALPPFVVELFLDTPYLPTFDFHSDFPLTLLTLLTTTSPTNLRVFESTRISQLVCGLEASSRATLNITSLRLLPQTILTWMIGHSRHNLILQSVLTGMLPKEYRRVASVRSRCCSVNRVHQVASSHASHFYLGFVKITGRIAALTSVCMHRGNLLTECIQVNGGTSPPFRKSHLF